VDATAAIWDGLAPLRDRFPDVRWIRRDLLHMTLVFMGDTDSALVTQVGEALANVASHHATFRSSTNGASGHIEDPPSARRVGVAWLTVDEGYRETVALSLDVDTAISTRAYDDRRRPRPHLTVARGVDVAALAAVRDFAASLRFDWPTSEVVLFRSFTGAGGSRYEPLRTSHLRTTTT
jgi:2'-5' RNA ligase